MNNVNLKDNLAYEATFDCIQCGYCLPVCPTYKSMKSETQSPRGRINLVKLAAEGKISLSELEEPIDLCLGCRACETACPTGVKYGEILDSAKSVLHKYKIKNNNKLVYSWQTSIMKYVFTNNNILNATQNLLWGYQKSRLATFSRKAGLVHLLPKSIQEFEKVMPKIPRTKHKKKRSDNKVMNREPVYTIAFFTGCIMDTMFSNINDLSIELLKKVGCEVIVLKNQKCCGALHAHTGDEDTAKQLAKSNIKTFENLDVDFIVNNAGGCGAKLFEYPKYFNDNSQWKQRAKDFSSKVVDISVILSRLNLPFKNEIKSTVTYQPSCHMTHVQKEIEAPLKLIRSIPGIRFQPMKQTDADMCCGSAGIYNLVNYEESIVILDDKMSHAKKTNASYIITTNPGCLLQIKYGIEREGLTEKIKAVHLVELLAKACE